MIEERTIDLGYPDLLDEPERARLTAGGRVRLIGLAALTLACVTAFGGAARPPAAAVTHAGFIAWPHGALPDQTSPERWLPTLAAGLVMAQAAGEVFAYHPDGRLAWRSRPFTGIPEGFGSYHLIPWEDDVLLVGAPRTDVGGARPPARVSVALDPATGRERWRMDGIPERVGDLVMVTSDEPDGSRGRSIYRRLPDGLLWRVPPSRMIATDPGTDALMTLTDEGRFTEYQLSTGTPRRSAHLRVPHVAPTQQNAWEEAVEEAVEDLAMWLFRDRLILRASKASRLEESFQTLSYDRATLQLAAPSPLDRFFAMGECGPVLCGRTFERTYILDRDSLAELWHTDVGEDPDWTADGLLLQWSRPPRLVDERTGQTRLSASGWDMVHRPYQSPGYGETTPTLMTQRGGERTFVGRLTPQKVRVIGVIPHWLRDCQYHEELLACTTLDRRTGVWRLDAS